MKVFFKIVMFVTLLLFLFSATSCVVLSPARNHDNGKHKGWYKNSHKKSSIKKNGKEYKNNSKGKYKKY